MKIIFTALCLFGGASALAQTDSLYLFAYGTAKNDHHNGLHLAWSADRVQWNAIGPEYSFLRSDYGRWGSQKKMYTPFLSRSKDGLWHCVWSLNPEDGAFGYATSTNLLEWSRQFYPVVSPGKAVLEPVLLENTFTWKSGDGKGYAAEKKGTQFLVGKTVESRKDLRTSAWINGSEVKGTLHRISGPEWRQLLDGHRISEAKRLQNGERLASVPSDAKMRIQIEPDFTQKKPISELLMGVFFEDINYAADGGLYAELVQNRDFEYALSDKEGRDPHWHSKKAWNGADFKIDSLQPIHPHNPHYAQLLSKGGDVKLSNEGFAGMVFQEGEAYFFSAFVRSSGGGKFTVRLIGDRDEVLAEALVAGGNKVWKKEKITLVAKGAAKAGRLELVPQKKGSWDFDMVSLMPAKTFKGHGLREDLAQTIADLKPKFVRFPGGCVAHGDGIGNLYRWETTVGPWEARKPLRNLWGYHQTKGLGFYEYFQFCEDIGAEPVPVVAAGVPCQNSAHHGCAIGGQQGGIPMDEMDAYVQSILDLIEYANGDQSTPWGKKRAEAGHPAPFGMKYLGIGNEDLITDIFEERFRLIYDAVKAKHPEIVLIGTVGPFNEGTDYVEGWKLAQAMELPVVDEHYYQTPGWFLNNQHFYDAYDRSGSKVYLGEYAAHIPGRHSNLETALSEALHLINVERNADQVIMTSYAPLLAKEGFTQWSPDLIYFNNEEVKPTVGYEVQKLFGNNAGNTYVPSRVSGALDARKIAVSIVENQDNYILKVVNLHSISAEVTWPVLGKGIKEVTVLSGTLEDKAVKPRTVALPEKLAPYSLTIINFNK